MWTINIPWDAFAVTNRYRKEKTYLLLIQRYPISKTHLHWSCLIYCFISLSCNAPIFYLWDYRLLERIQYLSDSYLTHLDECRNSFLFIYTPYIFLYLFYVKLMVLWKDVIFKSLKYGLIVTVLNNKSFQFHFTQIVQ